jgi:prepilin-type N-terminal cleavage/methylation domain-containing protein
MHRTQLTTIPSRHRPRVSKCLCRGFTLIELLVATLLAALLMAAVLGVLKGVTRSQKTLMRRDPDAAWKARLISQLEWDLANSRSVVPTVDGFQLAGFAGRDFASGAALHGPTTIQYAVRNLAGQLWLVRSESHLDSLNLDNDSLEFVCNKVERIVFDSPDKQASQGRDKPKPQAKSVEDAPIPDQPLVLLYGTGQEKPIFEHAFVLR